MDGIESLARLRSDDSDRTKLLKTVLKSSAQLHRDLRVALGGSAKKGSKYFSYDPNAGKDAKKDKARARSAANQPSLAERLEEFAQGDVGLCEEYIGPGMSPVLRTCGTRIGGLSKKLSELEGGLVLCGGTLPPLPAEEDFRIEIVPRGQEAPAAARQRAESASGRQVHKCARFVPLDDLSQIIETPLKGFQPLRESFPRKARLHPNVVLLNDQTLRTTGEFREAVWKKSTEEDRGRPIRTGSSNAEVPVLDSTPLKHKLSRRLNKSEPNLHQHNF